MYDFEELTAEVLKARPELTREELMKRINEKKETVGAGYLTSQGALFLVAGELGVSLQNDLSSDLGVKDMFIGANDVTVVARVLAIYPAATYERKEGGSGKYRRMVLFDKDGQIKATLWEEKADEAEKEGVVMGSAVRLKNAYVKQGLDGKATVNLGKRGAVALVPGEESAKLPTVESSAVVLPKLNDERPFVALKAVVSAEPRYSEFVRSDGSPGSLFQFGVRGREGDQEVRVVLWSPATQPNLTVGGRVVLVNVRSRRSNRGDFELHGDAGSVVIQDIHKEVLDLRAAAVLESSRMKSILCVDREKRVRLVEAAREAEVKVGDFVKAAPDSESGGVLKCTSAGALRVSDGESFPGLEALLTKVKDVKEDGMLVMLEVIALSHGAVESVQRKDGSETKRGELVVGDDTDETKLVAWGEDSSKVLGVQPGERLRLIGVSGKSVRPSAWNLQASWFTAVQKMKGR